MSGASARTLRTQMARPPTPQATIASTPASTAITFLPADPPERACRLCRDRIDIGENQKGYRPSGGGPSGRERSCNPRRAQVWAKSGKDQPQTGQGLVPCCCFRCTATTACVLYV